MMRQKMIRQQIYQFSRDRKKAPLRIILLLVLLVMIMSRMAVAGETREAIRPVNIIAIVTDDQARWAVGAYGNKEIHTPNMDRLAREGILFTNAFVETPVCSPSRATYLTGLYPTEHTIRDALDNNMDYSQMGFRSLTWTTVLKRNGYRTALFGKWHLGPPRPEFLPGAHGIDHFFGWPDQKPANINPVFYVDPEEGPLPVWRDEARGGIQRRFDGALVDVLTEQSISFMESNRSKPFAVLLHHLAPHKPYLPVLDEDMAHYTDLDPEIPPDLPEYVPTRWYKQQVREYYASVTSADRSLGRILDYLDESGLSENTLVVFTSDHGYSLGRHGIDTKGNGRLIAEKLNRGPRMPNMYDNSMRIPLIMRGPGVVTPGSKVDSIARNIDFFRTYLGALNLPIPDDFHGHGIDLSPALRGEPLPERETVYGQYDLNLDGLAYLRMVRTHRWKYIRHFRTYFHDELYDLEKDPHELNNLINNRGSEEAGRRGSPRPGTISGAEFGDLKNRLFRWMKAIDDPLLEGTY